MFQKNIVYYHQSSAQSPLKLSRPPKHWGEGRLLGRLSRPKANSGSRFGDTSYISPSVMGLGSALRSLSGTRDGGAPTAQRFPLFWEIGLRWHY